MFSICPCWNKTLLKRGKLTKKTSQLEFEDDSKGEEYKVKAIYDCAVYTRESKSGHFPGLYNLISWKGYPKEKNT